MLRFQQDKNQLTEAEKMTDIYKHFQIHFLHKSYRIQISLKFLLRINIGLINGLPPVQCKTVTY